MSKKSSTNSTATAEALRPQLAEVRSQIERLGPAPNDQPETPTIAAERARLNALAGALDGAIKTTELAWVRAKQMIDRITVMRYQIFSRNLFERRASPLLPSVWHEVGSAFRPSSAAHRYYGANWLEQAPTSKALPLLGVLVGAIGAAFVIRSFVNQLDRQATRPLRGHPDLLRSDHLGGGRRAGADAGADGRRLASSMSEWTGSSMFFSPWERTAETALLGVLIYIAGSVLASVALAPQPAAVAAHPRR